MDKKLLVLILLALLVGSSTVLAEGPILRYYRGPALEPIPDSGPFDSWYSGPELAPVYDSDPIDAVFSGPALEPIADSGPYEAHFNGPALNPVYDVGCRQLITKYVTEKSKNIAE